MAFARAHGFLPDEASSASWRVDPRTVAPRRAPTRSGMRRAALDELPDLRLLLETHNLAAADDPAAQPQRYTVDQFRADWWNGPDNVPDLSWALLADEPSDAGRRGVHQRPGRPRPRRSWSSMTATHRPTEAGGSRRGSSAGP